VPVRHTMLARLGDERLLNPLVKSVGITNHKLLRVDRLLFMADISPPYVGIRSRRFGMALLTWSAFHGIYPILGG